MFTGKQTNLNELCSLLSLVVNCFKCVHESSLGGGLHISLSISAL